MKDAPGNSFLWSAENVSLKEKMLAVNTMYTSGVGTVIPLVSFRGSFTDRKARKFSVVTVRPEKMLGFTRNPRLILSRASLNSGNSVNSGGGYEDFVTRVLRENPSQVEPKYLVGDKLYTLKERESLGRNGVGEKVLEILKRWKLKTLESISDQERRLRKPDREVYLKELLREYKGKLYVPDHVFGVNLSEEEEFDKNVRELPIMSYEDFQKFLDNNKVKLVTFMEGNEVFRVYRDFVVDLQELSFQSRLNRTKWAMRLDQEQVEDLLETYKGPRKEIEQQMMSSIGKLSQYPHPVASKISSRMMVEFGVLTAIIVAAAAVVGSFLASAVAVVASAFYVFAAYVLWPLAKAVLRIIVYGIFERVWDNVVEAFGAGGLADRLYDMYTFGGVASSIETLKPILFVSTIMVLLLRFTLSRRPKNFRKWDLWQGIEFSQSKAEARVDGSTGVKFSDVAGIDEAVEELQELVRYLKNPELFDKMGIKPPHGVLLEGPPGCGKTLVAKAIAGEAGVPFYQMAGSEFVEVLVGVGSARIRDLFKRAKVNKPSVIFIDEIDALATRRQKTFSKSEDQMYNAATQEKETTLNQLLIELDGFDTGKGVIFLGATNRRDLLDPALLRPGRFDRKIRIRPPNAKGRFDILKVHASKVKISNNVDLSIYANNLPGWSGAKLAQLLQEAALVAVRKRHTAILQSDMDDAVDRLTVGPRLFGVKLGHQGQCRRAATEVGVALVSHLLRRLENAKVEPCDRVSIHPRGQTLSQVIFNRLDDESYIFERRPQLLHRMQVLLGGRAAEEVIFGRDTSKASVSYLADASWLARKIVTIWNLESSMIVHGEPPPWKKRSKFVGPTISFEGSLYDDYDLIEPPINFKMDDNIARKTEQLMHENYMKTMALLKQHEAALLKTVKVLVDQKEITGDDIDFILDHYPENTPVSLVMEERSPGSLPLFEPEQEQSKLLEGSGC